MNDPVAGEKQPAGGWPYYVLRAAPRVLSPEPGASAVSADAQRGAAGTVEVVGLGDIIDVVSRAMEVLGDREQALRWLRTPVPSLGNQTPESLIGEEGGIARVVDALGRIEYGVW